MTTLLSECFGFLHNTVPEKLLWIFYFLTNFVEIAVFY